MAEYKILKNRPDIKKVMTISEFCNEYNLGRNKAYTLCHKSDAPVIFNGKKILFIKAKVDEWMESLIGKHI